MEDTDDINDVETKEIDTNASPTAYGWAFQVGAGIWLMLENIKNFTKMKMEGKDDDIQISIGNGEIYAQAKSVCQIGNTNNTAKNLNDALTILKLNQQNNNATQLIYITNIINPLSSKIASAFEFNHTYYYDNLPEDSQKKICRRKF